MQAKQPRKGWLWLNDGSRARLRPEHGSHVWSYDFVHCRSDDGKVFGTLNILDENSRECLAIRVDQGFQFTSTELDFWVYANGGVLDSSRPRRPTDNTYAESYKTIVRTECLGRH